MSFVWNNSTVATAPFIKRNRQNWAFTLVELLVVIAVIIVLAALILPALSHAKEKAKRAFCQNNLRQLDLALTIYSNENGLYPPCSSIFHVPGSVSLWNGRLLQDLGNNVDVFYCPAFPAYFRWTKTPSPDGYSFPNNIEGIRPFCYAINQNGSAPGGFGIGTGQVIPQVPGRKPDEIRAPSDMIAIGDD